MIIRLFVFGCLLFELAVGAAVVNFWERSPAARSDAALETPIQNANHMFNAIRGAMRQWDNSWNHNGMSFFVVDVPEGVQFYHGTGRSEPIVGLEWLAFEPEHALMFARGSMRPPPGHRGPGEHPPPHLSDTSHMSTDDSVPPFDRPRHHPPLPRLDRDRHDHSKIPETQHVFGQARPQQREPDIEDERPGYLHFYRASHDLKLVYIDGLSAGKTSKGTLDSQDYILALNKYNASNSPFRERERANALCELARTTWSGLVHGFIRMESGFEIILCDFEAGLTFERAQEVAPHRYDKPGRERVLVDSFRLYRAIADRFNGIGGGRASVNYASFVSAFDWEFAKDLFIEDKAFPGQTLPRLDEQAEDDLLALQKKVIDTIDIVVRGEIEPTVDWQAIAEMFVQRYATSLRYLVESELSEKEFKGELRSLLWPFVSDKPDDTQVVTKRCIEQFTPEIWQTTLAGRVVHQVASELCITLAETFHNLENQEDDVPAASSKKAISDLISYLDWPMWRECFPACSYNEVCVLPVWPITGNIEDREAPTCKNSTAFNGMTDPARRNGSYWWNGEERHGPPPGMHADLRDW